nr:transcription factor Adf-1 isoform X5 [Drosophila virilis]
MKLCQESRWRYFKQMQFLVDSIRQYRESLLGKCANGSQNANQVADPTQQQQAQQQTVVDIFAQPFNGSATTSAQALTHPHVEQISEITVTGDAQLATAVGKDQKPYFYEPPLKRERSEEEHSDNMLNTIKIFQNNVSQAVSAEDQSFGMVVTDMLNTLGVRQKAEAKVHIIKYLTDMQLLAQHNKY